MKKFFMLFIAAFSIIQVFGQNTFTAIIKDGEVNEPLVGASAVLEGTTTGASANSEGILEIQNIPDGRQIISFSFIGYETLKEDYTFPLSQTDTVEIFLNREGEELEEVTVSSTRSSRTIENIPSRVEFIAGEELEEKGNMKPGDIRMMLNESTGIQTQQTSATSYNSSIRIQGLDGKYTQMLRDGFPLYSGFSGGLSLLQIVPLDLKQVEVIKGASSTLYGGGAIAGLVNLISKTPGEERELNFLLNGTSALGLDVSGFYSEKFNKTGTTIFASYNLGTPYDPADIGLTAIPKFDRYTVNPKLFFYFNDQTSMFVGVNHTSENRTGGDIRFIRGNEDINHSYFERNKTNRFSTQFGFDRNINEKSGFSIKNSVGYYDRTIEIPDYKFSGVQVSSFSEISFSRKTENSEWIGGLNVWTDKFSQVKIDTAKVVDYNYTTIGAFIQNTINATEKFSFETGLRGDYQNEFGFFVLPRIAALWKISPKFSARISGGMGYKAPTVFTEDAEKIQFRNVLPIDISNTKAERSIGGNFDIDYKTPFSENVFFTLNALLFYTKIQNPLILAKQSGNLYSFQQPKGYFDTKGVETNIKLTYGDVKLFIGYTLADVKKHYNTTTDFELVAKHRLNNVLMYEVEEKLKIGLEAYYYSPQKLNDGTTGEDYWIFGLMTEKIWENFSLFINFENFTDTRQTRFDTIYEGTITNPTFRDIYAPVDGFVINGGLKIKL